MSVPLSPAQTPDMAKRKKNKGSTDNSVKKRKREEEAQAANAHVDGEPTAKKPKKRKSKGVEDKVAEAEIEQAASILPSKPIDATNGQQASTEAIETPVAEVKEKKKKKRKEQPNGAVEAQANGTPVTEKASKKDRRGSVDGAHAKAEGSTVIATTSEKAGQGATAPDTSLENHTPFTQQTSSFYLALSPCANDFPLQGLCAEHISPLLLTYYPPLKGVVLSYSNPRLSEGPGDSGPSSELVLARSIDEYAVTYVWLTADFVLFRPDQGTWLEGYVNLQNESLLGLVCYNYFNASIDRSRLPSDWKWVAGEDGEDSSKGLRGSGGCWVDGLGEKVEGRQVFRVKDFEPTPGVEAGTGSINIAGTLLSEQEEGRKVEGGERLRT